MKWYHRRADGMGLVLDKLSFPFCYFLLCFMSCVTYNNCSSWYRAGSLLASFTWSQKVSLIGDCLYVPAAALLGALQSCLENRQKVKNVEGCKGLKWGQLAKPPQNQGLLSPSLPPEDWDIHSAAKISQRCVMQSHHCQQLQLGCSCSSQHWTWASGWRQFASSPISA